MKRGSTSDQRETWATAATPAADGGGLSENAIKLQHVLVQLQASEANLAAAQALAHLGSWEVDLGTLKCTYSAEMFRLMHRDPALGGPSFEELLASVHPDDRALIEDVTTLAAKAAAPYPVELRTHPSMGPERHLSAMVQLVRAAGGLPARLVASALDVTQRRAAALASAQREREIERISRLYAALSHVSQALVRMPSQDELFGKVCRILVEHGGFRMAWIGWNDLATHALVPVASWGDRDGYLETIRVYTDDRAEGLGPSGSAFRDGRPYVANGLLEDPASVAWRPAMAARGFLASAAFPISERGQVRGVLSVYADEAGYFRDKEVSLLSEAAVDISFALDNLARETDRREAEEKVRRERDFSDAVLNSLPGVFYLYDQSGRFLRWNGAFESTSGYSGQEISAMHPLDLFDAAEKERVAARIDEVFRTGKSSVEATLVAKDGRQVPHHFTGVRLELDGKPCLIGVGIDIGVRVRAETALRELNETLELKVTERTGELGAALLRAEAADRLKSAFLATMSHELRTPLNSIIGFTGIILQGLAGPLTGEQAKQLGMVRGSARHLLELINDVLDLSKIEAGQLEVRPEPFDLRAAIERVTEVVMVLAEKKGLSLTTSISDDVKEVTSDRRRVEQILLNLLSNAVKFMDTGTVALTAELVSRQATPPSSSAEATVRIRVSDTGIGIRPEALQTLFQPFQQLDTGLSRQHEGTGLGLAICRRLATLLGGQISAESEWGQGSTFIVTLPLRTPAAKAQ